jgi:hypothetical protein
MLKTRSMMRRPLFGGCDFAVDPDLAAPDAPVFWLPAAAPAAAHAVVAVPDLAPDAVELGHSVAAVRDDPMGQRWLRLRAGAVLVGRRREIGGTPVGIVLPLDEHWPIRHAAAERLRRRLLGARVPPPMTGPQARRFKTALQAVDAGRAGAGYRDLAAHLFGARRLVGEAWKTSALKAQIARLAAHGRSLVAEGYRALLRGKAP